MLLCGAMFDINPEMEKFLNRAGQRVGMDIETFEMMTVYLNIFEASQMRKIEEMLTNYYG